MKRTLVGDNQTSVRHGDTERGALKRHRSTRRALVLLIPALMRGDLSTSSTTNSIAFAVAVLRLGGRLGAVRMGPYQLLWRRAATLCIEGSRHLAPLFQVSLVCGVLTCCTYRQWGTAQHGAPVAYRQTCPSLPGRHLFSDGSRSSSGSRTRTRASKLGLSDDCAFSIIVPFLFDGRGWIRSSLPSRKEESWRSKTVLDEGDFLSRGGSMRPLIGSQHPATQCPTPRHSVFRRREQQAPPSLAMCCRWRVTTFRPGVFPFSARQGRWLYSKVGAVI